MNMEEPLANARLKKAFKEGQGNVIGLLVSKPMLARGLPVTEIDEILDAFWQGALPLLQVSEANGYPCITTRITNPKNITSPIELYRSVIRATPLRVV